MVQTSIRKKILLHPTMEKKRSPTLIGADSLGYLPLECLHELTGTHSYCDACFSGKYATEIPTDVRKDRFEQKIIREVKQMEKWNKKLLLEDGSQFYGYGFGSQEEKITEIVFNTAAGWVSGDPF